jgi:hypothetical protein
MKYRIKTFLRQCTQNGKESLNLVLILTYKIKTFFYDSVHKIVKFCMWEWSAELRNFYDSVHKMVKKSLNLVLILTYKIKTFLRFCVHCRKKVLI